jgi:hypothetical protein
MGARKFLLILFGLLTIASSIALLLVFVGPNAKSVTYQNRSMAGLIFLVCGGFLRRQILSYNRD